MTPEVFTTLQLQTVDLMKMLILFSPVAPCDLGLTGAFCQHFRLDDNASVERNLLGDLGRTVGQVVHGQWIESLNKQHSCEDSVSDVVREIGKDNLLLSSLFIGSGVSACSSAACLSLSQALISHFTEFQWISPRLHWSKRDTYIDLHWSLIQSLNYVITMLNSWPLTSHTLLALIVVSYASDIPRTLLEPGSFSWQRWLWWTCWWPAQVCQAISVWYSQRRSKLLKLRNLSNPLSLYLDTTLNMILRLLQ